MANYTPATAKPVVDGKTRPSDIDLYYARTAMADYLNHIEKQLLANKELGHDLFTIEDALDTALVFFRSYVKEA